MKKKTYVFLKNEMSLLYTSLAKQNNKCESRSPCLTPHLHDRWSIMQP